MAEAQRVRAADLHTAGVVHHVVPELPGDTSESLARAVTAAIASSLAAKTPRILSA